jgi:hypothetical protein
MTREIHCPGYHGADRRHQNGRTWAGWAAVLLTGIIVGGGIVSSIVTTQADVRRIDRELEKQGQAVYLVPILMERIDKLTAEMSRLQTAITHLAESNVERRHRESRSGP